MNAEWWNGSDLRPMESVEESTIVCDTCEHIVEAGDVLNTPFGRFCGDDCASVGEQQFTEYMKREGFMDVQPDLLTAEEK